MSSLTFVATPVDIYSAFELAADCTIGSVDPRAPAELRAVAKAGFKIVALGGNPVSTRCDLRATLSLLGEQEAVTVECVDPSVPPPVSAYTPEAHGLSSAAQRPRPPSSSSEDGEDVSTFAGGAGPSAQGSGASPAPPSLSGFAQMPVQPANTVPVTRRSMRQALEASLRKVQTGRCVIIACSNNSVNPLGELELMAKALGKEIVCVDGGKRLKARLSEEALADAFVNSLKTGKWFVVLRGQKSIAMLQRLGQLLEECWEAQLRDVHPESKIFIATEPHPHFPSSLTRNCHPMKVESSFATSASLWETINGGSASCLRILQDQDPRDRLGAANAAAAIADILHPSDTPPASALSTAPKAPKARVKISSTVDVVDIEARDIFQRDSNRGAAPKAEINVAGSIVLKNTFAALPQDKFFSISYAGDDRSRYAIGSSTGNVYIVDTQGAALLSIHAHDASVWDSSFASQWCFVTGSEDGTASRWELDPTKQPVVQTTDGSAAAAATGASDEPTMSSVDSISCGGDVYAVRVNGECSLFAVGGLANCLLIRPLSSPPPASSVPPQRVELGTSVQCLGSLFERNFIAGGGDGSTMIIDATTGTVSTKVVIHSKKVPCIATAGSMVFTGSFDSTLRLWDFRSHAPQHTMKFKNYVTGLDVDDNHLVACVGDSLYLWDVRNLQTVLGGFPHAWSGLNRGVRISADANTIVTASPDGLARFWRYK